MVRTSLVKICKIQKFKTFSLHQNDAHKLSDAAQKILVTGGMQGFRLV